MMPVSGRITARQKQILSAFTGGPLHEKDAWRRASRSYTDTTPIHGPLKALVDRGLLHRFKQGRYIYELTDAGWEALRDAG